MFFSRKKKSGPQFIYSEKEIDEIDQFIIEHFGNYPNVIHEIFSPDIHLDIFELMKQKGTYIDALDINRRNTFI